MFRAMATMMFCIAYSARMEMRVVSTPAPAISGKMIGTTFAAEAGPSFFMISTPRVISMP